MKKIGDLQTPFHNSASQSTAVKGAGVELTGGYDVKGGDKSTPGQIPEVTTVHVSGGPGVNDHVTVGDVVARPKGSGMGQV